MTKYYLKLISRNRYLLKKRLLLCIIAVIFIALSVGMVYTINNIFFARKKNVEATSAVIQNNQSISRLSEDDLLKEALPSIAPSGVQTSSDRYFVTQLPRSDDPNFPAKYSAVYNRNGHKCAYLTFDDGPSYLTPKILDILKKYDIKATFFVVGNLAEKHPDIVKRASDEGHLIANHSYSHDYKTIYASEENFKQEFLKTQVIIQNIVGENKLTNLIRMPGGAQPASKDVFKKAAGEMGLVFIDWNAVNGDGSGQHLTVAKSVANVEHYAKIKDDIVLLMHDAGAKKVTYESLEQNIILLKKYGFEFKRLNEYDEPTVDVSNEVK